MANSIKLPEADNNDVEAWKEAHRNLNLAIIAVKDSISIEKKKRRHLLIQICKNLTEDGKPTNDSTWGTSAAGVDGVNDGNRSQQKQVEGKRSSSPSSKKRDKKLNKATTTVIGDEITEKGEVNDDDNNKMIDRDVSSDDHTKKTHPSSSSKKKESDEKYAMTPPKKRPKFIKSSQNNEISSEKKVKPDFQSFTNIDHSYPSESVNSSNIPTLQQQEQVLSEPSQNLHHYSFAGGKQPQQNTLETPFDAFQQQQQQQLLHYSEQPRNDLGHHHQLMHPVAGSRVAPPPSIGYYNDPRDIMVPYGAPAPTNDTTALQQSLLQHQHHQQQINYLQQQPTSFIAAQHSRLPSALFPSQYFPTTIGANTAPMEHRHSMDHDLDDDSSS